MRWLIIVFLFSLAVNSAPANSLAEVQRELRGRRYYFGPLDGRESAETTAALREFQKSKALDATGRVDEETLRALGLVAARPQSADSRAQAIGRDWIARYWSACESGEWAKEEPFYADELRYYDAGVMPRSELREQRKLYYSAWPRRRHVPQLSFATWADAERELWITTRVRHEVTNDAGKKDVQTEELRFKLRERGGGWRAFEIGEAPARAPK